MSGPQTSITFTWDEEEITDGDAEAMIWRLGVALGWDLEFYEGDAETGLEVVS